MKPISLDFCERMIEKRPIETRWVAAKKRTKYCSALLVSIIDKETLLVTDGKVTWKAKREETFYR